MQTGSLSYLPLAGSQRFRQPIHCLRLTRSAGEGSCSRSSKLDRLFQAEAADDLVDGVFPARRFNQPGDEASSLLLRVEARGQPSGAHQAVLVCDPSSGQWVGLQRLDEGLVGRHRDRIQKAENILELLGDVSVTKVGTGGNRSSQPLSTLAFRSDLGSPTSLRTMKTADFCGAAMGSVGEDKRADVVPAIGRRLQHGALDRVPGSGPCAVVLNVADDRDPGVGLSGAEQCAECPFGAVDPVVGQRILVACFRRSLPGDRWRWRAPFVGSISKEPPPAWSVSLDVLNAVGLVKTFASPHLTPSSALCC